LWVREEIAEAWRRRAALRAQGTRRWHRRRDVGKVTTVVMIAVSGAGTGGS
jgi:hypothetical protein